MFRFRSRSQSGQPLFDAAENFNHALALAREARGEPVGGLSRKAWKLRNNLSSEKSTVFRALLGGAVAVAGYYFVRNQVMSSSTAQTRSRSVSRKAA